MDWEYFSFKRDGVIVEVHDASMAHDLIDQGALTAEILVSAFRDGIQVRLPAGEMPQLAAFFVPDAPQAPVEKSPAPPPQPEQKPPPASLRAKPESHPPTPPAATVVKGQQFTPVRTWDKSANAPQSAQAKSRKDWFIAAGALAFLVLLVISFWPSGETYWAIRKLHFYLKPQTSAISASTIGRGEELALVAADDPAWLKVAGGKYKGFFVMATDVAMTQPLVIDVSKAGTYRVQSSVDVGERPDLSASKIGRLKRKTKMKVIGIVRGQNGQGWAEVELPDGRIGYVPGQIFGLRDAPPPKDVIKTDTAAVQPPDKPDQPANAVADKAVGPIAPEIAPPARDRCARRATVIEQMFCRYPDLKDYDASMNAAYSRANTANPAMSGPSPGVWRQNMGCELDYACHVGAYRRRIDELNSIREKSVPANPSQQVAAAVPTNAAGWIRDSDYPQSAMRNEEEGAVGFSLTISPSGAVTGCQITASSGSETLDRATCALITRRAKFKPARDEAANPVSGSYRNRVRWQLPK